LELAGKQVVVVGLARSGIAAAEFLLRRGARVVATDRRPAAELAQEAVTLQEGGARLELGGHDPRTFTGADLVVVCPVAVPGSTLARSALTTLEALAPNG